MDGEVKGIKDFYDATAEQWSERWYENDLLLPLLRRFVAHFGKRPRILDAGCGAGYESMRLAKLGADVVGIDISEESLRIAREKNPGIPFIAMDCRRIDESLGFFDGIAAIALLVHIRDEELREVFLRLASVLKPGGLLFVAFCEGDGYCEKRSLTEIEGVKYDRAFYEHRIGRLIEAADLAGLGYFDEWTLPEPQEGWRYLLLRAKE